MLHHYLHRHLPTFTRAWHWFKAWYINRDLFERILSVVVATLCAVWLVYIILIAPSNAFPSGAYITVQEGATLSSIASDLKTRNVVRYSWLFKTAVRIFGDDTHVPAGVYYFPRPQNLLTVAMRIAAGDFNTTPVKVTIPEGSTVADISKILLKTLPDFNRNAFLSAAQGEEGYLFPDTYFFMPGDSTDAILSVFSNGLHTHLQKIKAQIDASKKPLPEILTMASLLEKEAPDVESRRMIAGILWHRIAIGMPLQVDAVFPYIIGKNSYELTKDDLKIDSPYNTYIHTGLPPGPIANPGLDSILAAVTPIKTSYVYYLSDRHGTLHYATTYDQFLALKHTYVNQ